MNVPDRSFDRADSLLAQASSVVALTGAGISSESGVPVFRGPEGLWHNYRPEDLATPGAFARNPALVWEWYRWRRERIGAARPNAGHDWLVRLERRVASFGLITQNVDGLHRQAGSVRVLELHGNIWHTACARGCGVSVDESPWLARPSGWPVQLTTGEVPRCTCGAPMRPGVVWFGESLDSAIVAAAIDLAETADVMIVIGTSALVHPAASLPHLTRRAGGAVIEINPDETPLSDAATVVLRGRAGEICAALEARR